MDEVRVDNESIKLRVSYLSESLQNANARNKILTQEVLELKKKGATTDETLKIARLKAKVTALKEDNKKVLALTEENKKANAEISRLKAVLKKRDAVLGEIGKLAKSD